MPRLRRSIAGCQACCSAGAMAPGEAGAAIRCCGSAHRTGKVSRSFSDGDSVMAIACPLPLGRAAPSVSLPYGHPNDLINALVNGWTGHWKKNNRRAICIGADATHANFLMQDDRLVAGDTDDRHDVDRVLGGTFQPDIASGPNMMSGWYRTRGDNRLRLGDKHDG
jgi:hypothetical protein